MFVPYFVVLSQCLFSFASISPGKKGLIALF